MPYQQSFSLSWYFPFIIWNNFYNILYIAIHYIFFPEPMYLHILPSLANTFVVIPISFPRSRFIIFSSIDFSLVLLCLIAIANPFYIITTISFNITSNLFCFNLKLIFPSFSFIESLYYFLRKYHFPSLIALYSP